VEKELRAAESAVSAALRAENLLPAAAGAFGARREAGEPADKPASPVFASAGLGAKLAHLALDKTPAQLGGVGHLGVRPPGGDAFYGETPKTFL
jgi:hypothetical protein